MAARGKDPQGAEDHSIHFLSDGLALSPAEYARLLARLAENGRIIPDEFSRDGIVTQLEEQIAAMLGKEAAVFLPAGRLPTIWRSASLREAAAEYWCSGRATSTTTPAIACRS